MDGRGRLYLCATPIGNLQDITLRAIETLRRVDLVAAEDTRRTRKLFSRHDIHTPMMSYREENRLKAGHKVIECLEGGGDVALVSDAGVPGISDPGTHLVSMCLERDIEVEALPGPNAALTALVISGLPTGRFIFEGFLPRKKGPRCRALEELQEEERTMVFYESPARIARTLADIEDVLGDRRVALARELTKKFEEVIRGNVSGVRERIGEEPVRGELVLVVEGSTGERGVTEEEALGEVERLRSSGMSLKDAVSAVAVKGSGLSRSKIYNLALKRLG
ncbi:MAG: 16S rRNA (cytidine(1402)-2'-O)-methyltransferase [Actinobacteria bacterium]|nr:16S rRNA (cytidine(1402)-2'-O)-methyltransferase [Actinomycetota bacterium]MCG2819119.1 16S rRNA (cytidine(1402)-2'-O)-methyltransferase [Actinomycetes bacterium]MBU4218726.1 16S rRNA (cytidine(1402)-2'-O)-methyltransferase [Actinomycetota bacterium]MBU4359455.1 16S rRNA (cytidine(1402)-2'-O)-methyltransferase [Actinomycetota bacterium]MBU4391326.1 16S rRNA (cytidine(1402)-2'-O)-methyltransferase [Actinomycetota bacterium]